MSKDDPLKAAARSAKWRAANRELAMARSMASRNKNGGYSTYMSRLNRAAVEELTDSYVAKQLGISVVSAPPELINMKRELIAMRRLSRQLNHEIINQPENQNGN